LASVQRRPDLRFAVRLGVSRQLHPMVQLSTEPYG
jgi:hypothetical protein